MDYKSKFEELRNEVSKDLENAKGLDVFKELKNKYLAKKGSISLMMNEIRNVDNKKEFGEIYNKVRKEVEAKIDARIAEEEAKLLNEKERKGGMLLQLMNVLGQIFNSFP